MVMGKKERSVEVLTSTPGMILGLVIVIFWNNMIFTLLSVTMLAAKFIRYFLSAPNFTLKSSETEQVPN